MLLAPHPTANITGLRRNPRVSPNAIDAPGLTRGPSGARSRCGSRNTCRGRRNCRSAVAILSIQKTLRDGTRRPGKPHHGSPAAASVAVTTRFFTIVHQQHPSRPRGRRGQFLSSAAISRVLPDWWR